MTDDLGPTLDFHDIAERVRIPAGDLGSVVSTARRRTRRQRRLLSATMAVAIASTAIAVDRLSSAPEQELPVAAGDGMRRGSLAMTWRRVEPASGLGMARGFTNEGPLYALSTAPGQREIGRDGRTNGVVWRSDDGVDWTSVTTLGNDLFLGDLSVRDQRVYAIGTAPGERVVTGQSPRLAASSLLVGWSDEDGRRWERQPLALDLSHQAATRRGAVMDVDVAAGPHGVVAVAVLNADLDVPALLPPGATAGVGWSTTATGVDVLGPRKPSPCGDGMKASEMMVQESGQLGEVPPTWCNDGEKGHVIAPQVAHDVLARYTWEQLGIAGDVVRAARREPIAWFAAPGTSEFRRVQLPEIAGVHAGLELTAGEHGFDILAITSDPFGSVAGQATLLHSDDGRTWRAANPAVPARWLTSLGSVGGRTAFVGGNDGGSIFAMDDGNGGWRSTPLSTVIDPALLDRRSVHAGAVSMGAFGVVVDAVLVPDDERGKADADIVHRVLVSRDGNTWEDIPLDEIVGEPKAAVTRVAVVGDRVVVTASLPVPDAPPGTRRQVVVVGSPA